ncbi:DUF1905 domain-containing protein [Telmatobacter bradus]|uniref:DUF1905 domain-containing protein n=1 Tax=Telmatobacter bradus TaxID=474953 RepID=UPI003B43CB34
MKQEFKAVLVAKGPKGAWTYLSAPFDVQEVFGSKARVAVAGTINGFPFRNSLMPEGDGTHSMMVSKKLLAGAKAQAGDIVTVSLDRDEEERPVTVPEELQIALKKHSHAAALFATLTPSQKSEYADWVSSAKQAATQASRSAKAIEMLAAGKKHVR